MADDASTHNKAGVFFFSPDVGPKQVLSLVLSEMWGARRTWACRATADTCCTAKALASGFAVWNSGFGFRDSGFGIQAWGFGTWGSNFEIEGSRFGIRVWGFEFRVRTAAGQWL
jgi:hypothetical protein